MLRLPAQAGGWVFRSQGEGLWLGQGMRVVAGGEGWSHGSPPLPPRPMCFLLQTPFPLQPSTPYTFVLINTPPHFRLGGGRPPPPVHSYLIPGLAKRRAYPLIAVGVAL